MLTLCICWFLWKGASWARWTVMVLCGLSLFVPVGFLLQAGLSLPSVLIASVLAGVILSILFILAIPARRHFVSEESR